jgi:hypothetical protein
MSSQYISSQYVFYENFYAWVPHLPNWICDWPKMRAFQRFLTGFKDFTSQRSAVWSCLHPDEVILREKIARKAASECTSRLRAEYLSTVPLKSLV